MCFKEAAVQQACYLDRSHLVCCHSLHCARVKVVLEHECMYAYIYFVQQDGYVKLVGAHMQKRQPGYTRVLSSRAVDQPPAVSQKTAFWLQYTAFSPGTCTMPAKSTDGTQPGSGTEATGEGCCRLPLPRPDC